MVGGTKFGSEAGNNMLVRKDLYVLKRSGAAFRDFLVETMDSIGYQPSYVGPDLWSYPAVKPDGFECYEYIICYRDSVLYISQNPRKAIERLQDNSKLKEDKIEPPGVSLGATISKIKLDRWYWRQFNEECRFSGGSHVEDCGELFDGGHLLCS